jgi:AcrR family transcriptional regulator
MAREAQKRRRGEPTTRERMIASTALLVRERGARATSIDDVLAHSGAPRGSVYHHFPGGRDEMLREATALAGRSITVLLRQAGANGPLAALDAIFDLYRAQLEGDDFRPGCPVVAVAIEEREDGDRSLQDAAATAFAKWEDVLATTLAGAGVKRARARELATMTIASFEGAIVLARVRRDIAPLETVRKELRARLRAELPAN